jgi:hypothetical protein
LKDINKLIKTPIDVAQHPFADQKGSSEQLVKENTKPSRQMTNRRRR